MKNIKTFENYILNKVDDEFKKMKSHKKGDIISNTTLYNYVNAMHDFDMDNDFIKDHIISYRNFKLYELSLDNIDLDSVSPLLVDDYLRIYNETKWYPPIIYDKNENIIIDGYHRANVMHKIGKKYILAWCGINNKK